MRLKVTKLTDARARRATAQRLKRAAVRATKPRTSFGTDTFLGESNDRLFRVIRTVNGQRTHVLTEWQCFADCVTFVQGRSKRHVLMIEELETGRWMANVA